LAKRTVHRERVVGFSYGSPMLAQQASGGRPEVYCFGTLRQSLPPRVPPFFDPPGALFRMNTPYKKSSLDFLRGVMVRFTVPACTLKFLGLLFCLKQSTVLLLFLSRVIAATGEHLPPSADVRHFFFFFS